MKRSILISLLIIFQGRSAVPDFEKLVYENSSSNNTHGVLISKDGKIVFESYQKDFKKSEVHYSWSMAKSITSLIFGIAESEGYLSREDFISQYYPEHFKKLSVKQRERKSKIQIKHLLSMTSGLLNLENYERDPFNSHVIKMLYRDGRKNMPLFSLQVDCGFEPGTRFSYSSADTMILMGILKKAVPSHLYPNYPWKKLFNPLEIKNATWERDQSGHFIGSSYLYLKPRDYVKIGELVLNGGKYKNKQIIPIEWIHYIQSSSTVFKKRDSLIERSQTDSNLSYSAHFWINEKTKKTPLTYDFLPRKTLFMFGHSGQIMAIIPEKKIVALRLANDQKKFDRDSFLKLVIESYGKNNEN